MHEEVLVEIQRVMTTQTSINFVTPPPQIQTNILGV